MKHWWAGVLLLACAITLHALVPRYEWHSLTQGIYVREDRWTGDAVWGKFDGVGAESEGHWIAAWDLGLRQRLAKLLTSPPPRTDDELFAQIDAALGTTPAQPSLFVRLGDWWRRYSGVCWLVALPLVWWIGTAWGRYREARRTDVRHPTMPAEPAP
jgi:hypothetical protein